MAHPSKTKGDRAERDLVAWLNANGFPNAERAYGAGRPDDCGDIDGIPGLVQEVKSHKVLKPTVWIPEMIGERTVARADHGIVVAKHHGQPDPAHWYVMTTVEDYYRLYLEADHQ